MSLPGTPFHRNGDTPYDLVAGAVPCRAGWLVVGAKARGTMFAPEEPKTMGSFAELLEDRPAYAIIGLHAPIGLPASSDGGGRVCDREARDLLGRSFRSVPLARARLGTAPNAGRDKSTISSHLKEVAAEMTPFRQRTVFEVLPELSFFELNGREPLKHPRYRPAGWQERIALLEGRIPSLDRVLSARLPGVAGYQLVDAAACLWTARRIFQRIGIRLPEDAEWDDQGLRMEIVR